MTIARRFMDIPELTEENRLEQDRHSHRCLFLRIPFLIVRLCPQSGQMARIGFPLVCD